MADFLAPVDLSKTLVTVGEKKAALTISKMLILGVLAGVFIGFAAHLATTISTGTCEWLGLKKFLTGAVFSCGLMLVIIPGSELWTGNNLMTVALMEKRISLTAMLRNWIPVYIGNLIGSIFLAWIIAQMSGLTNGVVGTTAIGIAGGKCILTPTEMVFRGIGCNWLVCLAVMMALAAQDISGKVWGIFFPIMAFVASGFEHCVANMYFIPAGLFSKGFAAAAEKASPAHMEALTVAGFMKNLTFVTIGNLIGGAIFTGVVYWWVFVRSTGAKK
ncbi:formate/nitrite transporter family protein [bacterium]|nr:formate/nitrite transporter family protein [candidate division CSSED10-310 bacterium]